MERLGSRISNIVDAVDQDFLALLDIGLYSGDMLHVFVAEHQLSSERYLIVR